MQLKQIYVLHYWNLNYNIRVIAYVGIGQNIHNCVVGAFSKRGVEVGKA